jgi:hypothetical protein
VQLEKTVFLNCLREKSTLVAAGKDLAQSLMGTPGGVRQTTNQNGSYSYRPTVQTNGLLRLPRLFLGLLHAVVAWLAQRLKWARPELHHVAAMRFNVVTDLGQLDATLLLAVLAERFLGQLP